MQGVQKGDIYLTMDWTPVVLEAGWNKAKREMDAHKKEKDQEKGHRKSRHSK